MSDIEMISVEVAYALPEKQKIIAFLVEPETTALEAVRQSGIVREFPEIEVETAKLGIFGQALGTKGLAKPAEYHMQPGDRIEIYRPLKADPKEARRRRAEKGQ